MTDLIECLQLGKAVAPADVLAEIARLNRTINHYKQLLEGADNRARRSVEEFATMKLRSEGVESERAANALLTEEVEQLRAELDAIRAPRWVCLEGMNADELAAYDQGSRECFAAVKKAITTDDGAGSSNEPWASVRKNLLALRRDAERYRWLRDHAEYFTGDINEDGSTKLTCFFWGGEPTLDRAVDAAMKEPK